MNNTIYMYWGSLLQLKTTVIHNQSINQSANQPK